MSGTSTTSSAAVRRERPTSPDGVVRLLRDAPPGWTVVPVGAGTHPALPGPEGDVLHLETSGLSGVESYEPADLTATVAAGTVLEELEAATTRHGQWLPLNPPRWRERTLGGVVAAGASGALWAGYGGVRDHVLGLTVITGDGRTLRLGGRVMKNVAGFDLTRLMVGSRGALGVITSVTVRLFPRPAREALLTAEGELGEVLDLAGRIRSAPVLPAGVMVHRPSAGDVRLLISIHGPAASVAADRRTLEAALGRTLAEAAGESAGEEARRGFRSAERCGGGGRVSFRTNTLPTASDAVAEAISAALPEASFTLDPLSGRIRVESADVPAEALIHLRGEVERRGGTLTLHRAPAPLLEAVGAHGSGPQAPSIAASIRQRFDPRGVLHRGGLPW